MSHTNGFAHPDHLARQEKIRAILANLESLDALNDEEYSRACARLTRDDIETLQRILTKIQEARREME